MNYFGKLIFSIGLAVSSFFGYHQPQNTNQVFGDFNPSGGQTYRLQSSISTTQNTITLTSFKEPISNIKYTMSYLNSSIEYGTIDPQNNSTKEFISFTGITQNSDGTALLTGVSRGLGFSFPYTASTTLASSHSGQAIFILSNPPQLTNQYANRANAQNINGVWNFDTPPILNNAGTSTLQAASIGFVTSQVLGTLPVIVASGGTGVASLPLNMFLVGNGASNITSTSSPTVAFIEATSSTVSTFRGGVMAIASSTFTATTTIAASNVISNALIVNNVPYSYPTAQGAASTTLINDGSGNLSSYRPDFTLIASSTLSSAVATTTFALPSGAGNDLHIIVDVVSVSGVTPINMQLNGDTGANYSYGVFNSANGIFTNNNGVSVIVLDSNGANSQGRYAVLDIDNTTGFAKKIAYQVTEASGTNVGGGFHGYAAYNSNTKITSVTIGAGFGGATMGVGTRISVYSSSK